MIVRDLIRTLKSEWLPCDSLLKWVAEDRTRLKQDVTRALLAALGDAELLLAWDSMPLWRVRGLGPKKAMALWQQGVRPGNLQRKLKLLPAATQTALRYPVMERVPRDMIERAVAEFVPRGEKSHCTVVGSYRRGLATSGDIDLLYSGEDFAKFITKVATHLGARWQLMSQGPSKVAGIFLYRPDAAVEVDIWISSPENRAYMLLYATGSRAHNIKMRFIARHRGYKLNQYALEDLATGRRVPARSEREIFKHLRMAWKAPEERI